MKRSKHLKKVVICPKVGTQTGFDVPQIWRSVQHDCRCHLQERIPRLRHHCRDTTHGYFGLELVGLVYFWICWFGLLWVSIGWFGKVHFGWVLIEICWFVDSSWLGGLNHWLEMRDCSRTDLGHRPPTSFLSLLTCPYLSTKRASMRFFYIMATWKFWWENKRLHALVCLRLDVPPTWKLVEKRLNWRWRLVLLAMPQVENISMNDMMWLAEECSSLHTQVWKLCNLMCIEHSTLHVT